MNALPPGLEDFGDRLTQAAEREAAERRRARPGRRWARNLGLPVGAALVAAAVSAGAVRYADRGGDPIEPERGASGSSLQAPTDRTLVVGSTTADPRGGPPWALRAYTNAAGRECVQVGQVRRGVFGQMQGGTFRALPASAPGTCGEPNARGPLVAVVRRGSGDVTIVYGIAIDRSPISVRFGDKVRRVQPAGFGAFVTVFGGADPRKVVVVRSKAGGRVDEQRFP